MASISSLARVMDGANTAPVRQPKPRSPYYSDALADALSQPDFSPVSTSTAAILRALTPAVGAYMRRDNDQARAAQDERKVADLDADFADLSTALGRPGTPGQELRGDETGTTTQAYKAPTPGGMEFNDLTGLRTETGRSLGLSRLDKQATDRATETRRAEDRALSDSRRSQDRAWAVEDRDLKLQTDALKVAADGGDPAAVRTFKFFEALPTDAAKAAFMTILRGPTTFNLGDARGVLDQTDPTKLSTQIPMGVAPKTDVDTANGRVVAIPAVVPASRQEGTPAPGPATPQAEGAPPVQPQPQAATVQQLPPSNKELTGLAKAEGAYRTFDEETARILRTIDEAEKLVSGWTTGYGGAALRYLPSTDARTLMNKLTELDSKVAFDALQEMRNNSPTGGALGAVTERELALLTGSKGVLDQLDENLPAALTKLRSVFTGARERVGAALEKDRAITNRGADGNTPAANPGRFTGMAADALMAVDPTTLKGADLEAYIAALKAAGAR